MHFNKCNKIINSKVQTNPRYKNFTQMYYTVGDSEQFWVANNLPVRFDKKLKSNDVKVPSSNIFKDKDTFVPFDGYKNVSQIQVEDTFNYIFNKFKKGIFIKIMDGKLHSFIPFSKAFYINEWSEYIQVDPKYSTIENFFKVHYDSINKVNNTKYKFDVNKVNLDPSYWFANNCILRYENPINEGETNYAQIKSMFTELCIEREIPDVEFFVNRRDFPILTRDGTEPYDNIFGENVPLKSYKFDKYTPILSMCSSDKFADIAIPTHEDWSRVKSKDGEFFPPKCKNYNFNFNLDWDNKKDMAVFRGSNTGCGYNIENNTRLKLASLGKLYPKFLDVGITNWNMRIRKHKDSKYLQIPNIGKLTLVDKLSPEQQSNYKFIINVDGHVSAFRLSLELSMGSVILLVDSVDKWKLWFSDFLRPYVHFVPVKSDLSNLMDQIEWCLNHQNECKTIVANALHFYKKYLSKKGILDNLQKTLIKLKEDMGNCKHKLDPLIFQMLEETKTLINEIPKEFKLTGDFPQNIGRNYGSLKGLERFITSSLRPDREITLVGTEVQPIFKSKTTMVTLYQVGSEYIIGKKTNTPMKRIEFIHDAFIGKKVMNNLLKFCPNFVFTLGYRDEVGVTRVESQSQFKDVTVLQEYINGPTLQEFLKDCSFKSYLEIILCLSCALKIAQNLYGFVHHDLKPWNIIVNILPEPIFIEYYLIDPDLTYKIETRFIPVIIDYGKSHVIYNNIHYGIIDPFNTSKNIDLTTLVLSTISNFNSEWSSIINFFTPKKITNHHELKNFIAKNKRLKNTLNYKNIFEDFITYITPQIKKYNIYFEKSELTMGLWTSNSRQISDMSHSIDIVDKINTYIQVPQRIYANPLPQSNNRFTTIFIAQKIFDGLNAPKLEFLEFASEYSLDKTKVNEVLDYFNRAEKFIMDFYTLQLKKKTRKPFKVDKDLDISLDIKPSRRLFLRCDYDIKLENVDKFNFPHIDYYKTLIVEMLTNRGPFKVSEEDKTFYMDNFKLFFDTKYSSKIIDIETIKFYSNL